MLYVSPPEYKLEPGPNSNRRDLIIIYNVELWYSYKLVANAVSKPVPIISFV